MFADGATIKAPVPSNRETDRDFQAFMRKATGVR
jgi:hypothetical protein